MCFGLSTCLQTCCWMTCSSRQLLLFDKSLPPLLCNTWHIGLLYSSTCSKSGKWRRQERYAACRVPQGLCNDTLRQWEFFQIEGWLSGFERRLTLEFVGKDFHTHPDDKGILRDWRHSFRWDLSYHPCTSTKIQSDIMKSVHSYLQAWWDLDLSMLLSYYLYSWWQVTSTKS